MRCYHGRNGVLTRARETRYENAIAEFEERTKLAGISLRASIDSNRLSKEGYIATTNDNLEELAKLVASDVGLQEIDAIKAGTGTDKINSEGYTVGYYLDLPGNEARDGYGYIVIWYTDNTFRSTLNRDEAIQKANIIDVTNDEDEALAILNKSQNQATLVRVIQVENYNCEMSNNGITSIIYGNQDIKQTRFKDTTLNGKLFKSPLKDAVGGVTITYKAESNNGVFSNNGTNTNVVTYKNGEVQSGTYLLPKYTSGSFRAWYTTATFVEGTEFDIISYSGEEDITVYAKSGPDRAKFNARNLNKFLQDGSADDGSGKKIKSAVVAVRQAKDVPTWAVGKNWNNNLGRNSEYFWMNGSNMGYDSTYTLPILIWYDCQSRILYWYSEDSSPILTYNDSYGVKSGFDGCTSLTDISGIENWDVSQMDQLEIFFKGCTNLTNLSPIKNWDVSNVTDMKETFAEMTKLSDASAINNWDITKVTNFTQMFNKTTQKPTFTKRTGTFNNVGTFIPN